MSYEEALDARKKRAAVCKGQVLKSFLATCSQGILGQKNTAVIRNTRRCGNNAYYYDDNAHISEACSGILTTDDIHSMASGDLQDAGYAAIIHTEAPEQDKIRNVTFVTDVLVVDLTGKARNRTDSTGTGLFVGVMLGGAAMAAVLLARE